MTRATSLLATRPSSLTRAEGSASDEAHAARAESEADGEPAIRQGSASDEAHAARAESEADGEPAIRQGSASDEAQPIEAKAKRTPKEAF